MRLVRFRTESQADNWGVSTDVGIRDLGNSVSGANSILDVIRHWETLKPSIEAAVESAPIAESSAQILSPVPEPSKTICIGLNYRDHAIESGMEIPSEPVVFNKLAGTVCGPNDEVPLPACSSKVDYEAELVVVIGKRCWQVSEGDALSHIFGYTCGHDVSARDWQIGRPGGQWLLGKSFPNFAPIGPYLVPAEDIADPGNLRVQLRLDGETLQDSTTKQLIFNPAQLIAHLSQFCVLNPGDLIFTGTPPGVGAARKPPRFIQPGEVAEVEIEGLGILTNRFTG